MGVGRVGFAAVGISATLLLVGCTSSPDGQDAAGGPQPSGSQEPLPDFDGDGSADLAVSVGEAPARVTIQYGSGSLTDLRRSDVDGVTSNTFGRALLARDLNVDGRTDLVVTDPAATGGAVLVVLFGSPDGLAVSQPHTISAPSGITSFGDAVTLVDSPTRMLAVGASGYSTSGSQGGGVLLWPLGADGLPQGDAEVLTQDSAGMPGDGQAGDAFGATLAATGYTLVVGAPRRDTAGVRDSGAVFVVDYADSKPAVHELSLGEGDVPGTPQVEQRFGFSLAAGGGYLVVGTPARDASARDSGMVQPYRLEGRGPVALDPITAPASDLSQDGLLFGFSVAMAHPCADVTGVLVGAPGAAATGLSTTGAAWLVPIEDKSCQGHEIVEGTAVGGEPTEMASLGVAVSTLVNRPGQPETLVLAAPGNAEEGIAGRVLTLDPPYVGPARTVLSGLRLREEGLLILPPGGIQ